MREILFRGKRVDSGEWVEGNLIKTEEGGNFIFNYYFIPAKSVPSSKFIEVMPETVGQYTGLKDKNGKNIFEGDLIELCGNKKGSVTVEFKNQYVGGWVLTNESTINHVSLGARKYTELKVIGTIHDNNETT